MFHIWLTVFIFFGSVWEVHCEEYKCCNKSANGFNCNNSFESLPTSSRVFENHAKASSVCKNYPAYKTKNGLVKELRNVSIESRCELCNVPGSVHLFTNNHAICSTCLGNIENYLEPECPICLFADEEEPVEVFQCLHSLHEACRPTSLTRCPICRSQITKSIKGLQRSEILSKNNAEEANEFDEEPVPVVVFMRKRSTEAREYRGYSHDYSSLHAQARPDRSLNLMQRFGQVESGMMKRTKLDELASQVISSQQNLSQHRYEKVALDPEEAQNDNERLAALAAREFFVLVDRSLGMSIPHQLRIGRQAYQPSSLWDSAKFATTSIVQLASALDVDNRVTVMFWNGNKGNLLEKEVHIVSSQGECEQIFRRQIPRGTSELGFAFNEIYGSHLQALFRKDEPFTVIVLTANVPTDMQRIDSFFNKITKENGLEVQGKETRAAFTMVNLGTNRRVSEVFSDLKNRLVYHQHLNVDLIEVKHADFLFGIGPHFGQTGVGPFALVWNAIFD